MSTPQRSPTQRSRMSTPRLFLDQPHRFVAGPTGSAKSRIIVDTLRSLLKPQTDGPARRHAARCTQNHSVVWTPTHPAPTSIRN